MVSRAGLNRTLRWIVWTQRAAEGFMPNGRDRQTDRSIPGPRRRERAPGRGEALWSPMGRGPALPLPRPFSLCASEVRGGPGGVRREARLGHLPGRGPIYIPEATNRCLSQFSPAEPSMDRRVKRSSHGSGEETVCSAEIDQAWEWCFLGLHPQSPSVPPLSTFFPPSGHPGLSNSFLQLNLFLGWWPSCPSVVSEPPSQVCLEIFGAGSVVVWVISPSHSFPLLWHCE